MASLGAALLPQGSGGLSPTSPTSSSPKKMLTRDYSMARQSSVVKVRSSMRRMSTSKYGAHVSDQKSLWTTRGLAVRTEADMETKIVTDEDGSLVTEVEVPDGSSSITASIIALVGTSVGTGLLSLPFAFSTMGVSLGMTILVFFVLVSGFCSSLLTYCCDWSATYSYEDLMVASFGDNGAVGMGFLVVWLLTGAMTSIVIVGADVMTQLVDAAVGSDASFATGDPSSLLSKAWAARHTVLMLANVFLVILPLSSVATTPSALAKSNSLAVTCILIALILLVTRGLSGMIFGDLSEQETFEGLQQFGSDDFFQMMKVVPIIMLSLGCQVQVPVVFGDLEDRTVPRMQKALASVGGVCFGAYTLVGVVGLIAILQLGGITAAANVLDSLPKDSWDALAMRLCMAIAATCVYPMLLLPCRSTVDHLVHVARGSTSLDDEESSNFLVAVERMAIVSATLAFGYCGGNLAKVFSFTGATAGALICYMLPPTCYLRLRKQIPEEDQCETKGTALGCYILLAFMIPLSCFELYLQVMVP